MITITADDVRGLLRMFPGFEQRPSAWDGWEAWQWRDEPVGAFIPVMPGAEEKADYQLRLWDAVIAAGNAMGIGVEIYVRLGALLARDAARSHGREVVPPTEEIQ